LPRHRFFWYFRLTIPNTATSQARSLFRVIAVFISFPWRALLRALTPKIIMEMWRALIRSPLGRGLGNATDPIQKKKKKKREKERKQKTSYQKK
jgi:hypothetical protein